MACLRDDFPDWKSLPGRPSANTNHETRLHDPPARSARATGSLHPASPHRDEGRVHSDHGPPLHHRHDRTRPTDHPPAMAPAESSRDLATRPGPVTDPGPCHAPSEMGPAPGDPAVRKKSPAGWSGPLHRLKPAGRTRFLRACGRDHSMIGSDRKSGFLPTAPCLPKVPIRSAKRSSRRLHRKATAAGFTRTRPLPTITPSSSSISCGNGTRKCDAAHGFHASSAADPEARSVSRSASEITVIPRDSALSRFDPPPSPARR